MKCLAIDTSLAIGSVAAIEGERIAVRTLPTVGEHARLLAAAIEAVAVELGWAAAAADIVGVVRGPGSFTGLRVGVTTAKALCWAGGSRLVGVSSGEAIARASAAAIGRHDRPITVVFDAGRGELFASVATPDPAASTGWRVGDGGLVTAAAWLDAMLPGEVVTGPGLGLVAATLDDRPDVLVAPRSAWLPDIVEVGRITLLRGSAGESDAPAALVPDYIRPSYADEQGSRAGR